MAIKGNALEVENINFGKLEDNPRIPSQRIAYISYKNDNKKLMIQTPEFICETYGIPREGPYYQTDKSRAFFKLPFCHESKRHQDEIDYAEIEKFYNKLCEIDNRCNTEEFRAVLFGEKNAAKYEYQPLVRTHVEQEEDENPFKSSDKIKVELLCAPLRPPYAKLKLELAYDTGEPLFKVFDKKDGKRTEIVVKEFKDALRHIKYMTKHRIIIHFSKLYAMKTSSGNEKKKYGIVLKATAIECVNKELPKPNPCEELFDDED